LRILWIYSVPDEWTRQWNERNLQQHRGAGFDVRGFCTTLPYLDGQWLPYYELNRRWRVGETSLMRMYHDLLNALADRDAFVLYNGANLHPEFVRWLDLFKVYTCADDPESTEILSKPLCRGYDVYLVNNIACVSMYRDWGMTNVHFWPLGSLATEEENGRLTEEEVGDIQNRDLKIFIACERMSPWRRDRLDKLIAAFPQAKCVGAGWPQSIVSWSDLWQLYKRAQIGWNLHNSTGPVNFRTYDLAAMGVMQICDNKEGLRKIYHHGREVVGFDTIEECIDLTRYYLDHVEEQRAIALGGWQRWRQDYTPERVWDRLIKMVTPAWEVQKQRRQPLDINCLQEQLHRHASRVFAKRLIHRSIRWSAHYLQRYRMRRLVKNLFLRDT